MTMARLVLVVVLLAAPFAEAQPAGKPTRIGLLDVISPSPSRQSLWDAFRQRLRELGYREGEQVVFVQQARRGLRERTAAARRQDVAVKHALPPSGSK